MEPTTYLLMERFLRAVERIADSVDTMSMDLHALNANVSGLKKDSICPNCPRSDRPSEEHVSVSPLEQQDTSNRSFTERNSTVSPIEHQNIAEDCDVTPRGDERGYTASEEFSSSEIQQSEGSELLSMQPSSSQTDAVGPDESWNAGTTGGLMAVDCGAMPVNAVVKEERHDEEPDNTEPRQEILFFNMGVTPAMKEEWPATSGSCTENKNVPEVTSEDHPSVNFPNNAGGETIEAGYSTGSQQTGFHFSDGDSTCGTSGKGDPPYQQGAMSSASGPHFLENPPRDISENELEALPSSSCPVCGGTFLVGFALTSHLMEHSPSHPFHCVLCQKVLSSKQSLKNHLNYHYGQRLFPCGICGKRFFQKVHLQDHIRTHTREKPYECPLCKEAFSAQTNLRKHIKRHSGERPFPCPICGKRFKEKYDMKVHQGVHRREAQLSAL